MEKSLWEPIPKQDSRFAKLMRLYSESYRQLALLVDFDALGTDRMVSVIAGQLPIFVEVTERHKYTSFVRLTYFIEDEVGVLKADPDAHVRVYHDTQQAEVTHCYPKQAAQPLFGALVPVADVVKHRWRANQFLDRWLEYLLKQGHSQETMRKARTGEWPEEANIVDLGKWSTDTSQSGR